MRNQNYIEHRGYTVYRALNGKFCIRAGSTLIAWCDSLEHGKQIIDNLLDSDAKKKSKVKKHCNHIIGIAASELYFDDMGPPDCVDMEFEFCPYCGEKLSKIEKAWYSRQQIKALSSK